MLKETSFYKVFAILAEDLRKHVPALTLVMLLATVSTVGEKAPLLLLKPLLDRVLFTEQAGAEAAPPQGAAVAPESAAKQTSSKNAVELGAAPRSLQDKASDWFFGPPGSIVTKADKGAALWKVVLGVALLTLLGAASGYTFTMVSRWVALRMVIDLRIRLARHLLGLSMRYHGERRFGDLLSRVSSDVTTTQGVVNVAFRDLTREPLLVLGSLGVAFAAAPKPTLAVVLCLPLVIVPIAVLGRKVKKRSRKSLTRLGASVEVLSQMFQGIRTVKAFRAEQREIERFREVNRQYLSSSMKMVRSVSSIQAWATIASQIGFVAVLLFVGLGTIHYDMFTSAGEMMQFFAGVSTVYTHIKRITNTANTVQEAAGAGERLQQIFDEPEDILERPDALYVQGLGRGIAFEGVSLSYPGQEQAALSDVSIAVRPGETLALVGASGAGKTTFVDLIARFLDPTAGRITVDGHDLRDLSLD